MDHEGEQFSLERLEGEELIVDVGRVGWFKVAPSINVVRIKNMKIKGRY